MIIYEYDGHPVAKHSGRHSITAHGRAAEPLARYIWRQHNGEIPDGYVIHHKDEVKDNDVIQNYQMMTGSNHSSYHNRKNNGWIMEEGEWVAKPCKECDEVKPLKAFTSKSGKIRSKCLWCAPERLNPVNINAFRTPPKKKPAPYDLSFMNTPIDYDLKYENIRKY